MMNFGLLVSVQVGATLYSIAVFPFSWKIKFENLMSPVGLYVGLHFGPLVITCQELGNDR